MNEFDKINQKNLPNWNNALEYLTKALMKHDITYYLSSSGLHYILGEKGVFPYDIDLFMSERDVIKAFDIFQEFKTSGLHRWEESLLEFQGEYDGVIFEICQWEKKPKKLENVKFKGMEISIVK
jgi:phosphorylcholine metabolism protein LicD